MEAALLSLNPGKLALLSKRRPSIGKICEALKKSPDTELAIDLPAQKLTVPGVGETSFEINAYKKECLMKGYSDIDYLLADKDAILKYEETHCL